MGTDHADTERPAKRVPNTSTTEAQWLEAMRWFPGGMSDGRIAQRLCVSNATVAAQRFKRGVYRADRPEAPRVAHAAPELPPPAPLPDKPDLRAAQQPPAKAEDGGDWRTWLF